MVDRLRPVADFHCTRRRRHDFGPDRCGILRARIVIGDDDDVGKPRRHFTHDRAFALVAVAAAAENRDDTARRERSDRSQHIFQRIRLMGIIHIGKRAVFRLAHQFQPAGSADQLFKRLHRHSGGNAGGHGKTGRHERIGHLKIAGEWNIHLVDHAVMMHFDHLFMTEMLHPFQRQVIALAADSANIKARITSGADRLLRPRIVGEDHRRCALFHQRIEQPHLRGHIVLNGRMIIHMIAAEIGETGRCKLHAIEAALVEAVARSLHRRMRYAFGGKLGQKRMQRYRIRRRQRAIILAAGRNDTRRADLRSGMAGKGPDLPHERGDRGLSSRAGDRNHGFRLFSVEPGCGKGEIEARVRNGQHRHVSLHRMSGNDSDRTLGNRVLHIGRAIRLGASDRHEQAAGLNLAAVCGYSPDFDRPDLRQEQFFQFRKRVSGYISQIHRLCPSCPPGANRRNIISSNNQ